MQKITPFLWFDGKAEEAVNFYVSLFPNSKVVTISRYGNEVPAMKGKVLTAVFQIDGQEFMAIDGGPQFHFTEALSMLVHCEDQTEVDKLWNALTADGGAESQCGWLKDKYGLSWQIVPNALGEMMSAGDPVKGGRMMQALMKMKKLDIAELKKAYEGK